MKKETAANVLVLMRKASAMINESIKVVQDGETPDVFKRYRTAAGEVMGELYFSIIEPIREKYPDLMPLGLEEEPKRRTKRGTAPRKKG